MDARRDSVNDMESVPKPCPFCGGNQQRVKHSGRWGWFVSCSCAAVGPSSETRDEPAGAAGILRRVRSEGGERR